MTTLKELGLTTNPINYFTRSVKPAGAEFTGMGISKEAKTSNLPAGFQTKAQLEGLYTGISSGTEAGAKEYVKFYKDRFTPTQIANFFLDDDYVNSKKAMGTEEISNGTELDSSKVDNGSLKLATNVLKELGFTVA